MVLAAKHDEVRLHVLRGVMAPLPLRKVDQVVDFEVFGRDALLTAATGAAQSYGYRIVPLQGIEILLPVEKVASLRAVFAPALWEGPRAVEAGLLGHSATRLQGTGSGLAPSTISSRWQSYLEQSQGASVGDGSLKHLRIR